jgi:hypothetical protein
VGLPEVVAEEVGALAAEAASGAGVGREGESVNGSGGVHERLLARERDR